MEKNEEAALMTFQDKEDRKTTKESTLKSIAFFLLFCLVFYWFLFWIENSGKYFWNKNKEDMFTNVESEQKVTSPVEKTERSATVDIKK